MQKISSSSSKLEWTNWLVLIPAILTLGLAPLFLHYSVMQYPALPVNWRLNSFMVADLFTYGKHYLILTAGFLAVLSIYFLGSIKQLKKTENKLFVIILSSAIVWLLLSTIASVFPYGALWGAAEKYEGLFIWLSYLSLALYTGILSSKEFYRTSILRIILFSGLIITGIGLTQFLSHDIIRTEWFKALIMPKEIAESARFVFEVDRIYTTLYNPNFVAMYAATLFPLAAFMIYREKKILFKGLWSLYSILLIINLIGSKSSGGISGLLLSAAVLCYILIIKRFELRTISRITVTSVFITSIVTISFIGGAFNSLLGVDKFAPKYTLTHISTQNFETTIEYGGKKLLVKADQMNLNSVSFYNEDKLQLGVTTNQDGSYGISSPDFKPISFTTGLTAEKLAFVNFLIDGHNWILLLHPNGMLYVNSLSTTVPIEPSKGLGGYVGYEGFGSARGYIWSRTLPLIISSPIVGYGADNFAIAFPQNDYNMKYQVLDTPNILIDKAHNLYLQLITNFGIPGFLLLLSIIGYSIHKLFLAYYSKSEPDRMLYLAIILCLFGYLGSGLFYDSSLHVSPFFWMLAGFGFKDLFK